MYKNFLFDLDGTITDPVKGITNSVIYALGKFNIKEEDVEKIKRFIGPPLKYSFNEYYGLSDADSETAVRYYREYYGNVGIFECKIYDDIPKVLESLKKSGKHIILATSKPEPYAERILKHFNLIGYFEHICGASFDTSRAEKKDVIKYAIKTAGISAPNRTVMVGDRNYDVLGARDNHIDAIGVTYGYGSEDELKKSGAKYIAASPKDLLKFIKNQ